jgi:glycosyltransferase involved in cell wall biosynthesis
VVKKAYYKTPLFVRNYFTPIRQEKVVRKAKALYGKAKNLRARKQPQFIQGSASSFEFQKGDTIISAGRAWDDSKYIDALESLKQISEVKLAYVVYDLIPIYQQHTFGPGLTERYSRYLYRILKAADYILPISKASKRDLLKYAEDIGLISLPVIETIRLGDDIVDVMSDQIPSFVKDPSSFTITVGTIEARKNHTEIYYAYKLAAEKGIILPDLYIIGKPGWLTGDIIYFIEHDTDVNQKIKIVYNVSDHELAWLYKNALYTVYPSQYEGWGLPIAESIAYGTPCIGSHASSMIEIAPTYVDHVSPFDTGELLDRMAYYAVPKNSLKKRQEIEAGYKLYSWDKLARALRKLVLN